MVEQNGKSEEPIEKSVTEDIGGWQGVDPDDATGADVAQQAESGVVPDEPAPDGAEIEWAGGLIKKPPSPTADR